MNDVLKEKYGSDINLYRNRNHSPESINEFSVDPNNHYIFTLEEVKVLMMVPNENPNRSIEDLSKKPAETKPLTKD